MCLPYISDEVTRRVRKIMKKSGLNIHIAQRSGPTLRSMLTRSNSLPSVLTVVNVWPAKQDWKVDVQPRMSFTDLNVPYVRRYISVRRKDR